MMPMPNPTASPSRDELLSAHFASMVMQTAQMALMLLGQMPHPETGQAVTDLEGARMFIDQLEMLEVKTKGNLTAEEEHLLKQSLVGTRMAFVEATGQGSDRGEAPDTSLSPGLETPPTAQADEDSRKKFSKKY
jgi:hypothetical protein